MDNDVRVDHETPKIVMPKVAGEPFNEFLKSKDSALANIVRSVVMANDDETNYSAFGSSAPPRQRS